MGSNVYAVGFCAVRVPVAYFLLHHPIPSIRYPIPIQKAGNSLPAGNRSETTRVGLSLKGAGGVMNLRDPQKTSIRIVSLRVGLVGPGWQTPPRLYDQSDYSGVVNAHGR
ncbi:hypothetical protein EVAR_812_1 [Eumeta japonica]|uniref:Uncharacterized protein n=1 Tax=Eumeta variegata TaxID=151549 RepID=A0A4C1SED4_EUMVA|nr:hypothetical protein EVAR_812_1 [Eumeta japonica]